MFFHRFNTCIFVQWSFSWEKNWVSICIVLKKKPFSHFSKLLVTPNLTWYWFQSYSFKYNFFKSCHPLPIFVADPNWHILEIHENRWYNLKKKIFRKLLKCLNGNFATNGQKFGLCIRLTFFSYYKYYHFSNIPEMGINIYVRRSNIFKQIDFL